MITYRASVRVTRPPPKITTGKSHAPLKHRVMTALAAHRHTSMFVTHSFMLRFLAATATRDRPTAKV